MSTDNLRLPVTVVDAFSGPLAKLRNQMQQVTNASGIKTLNADWKRVEGSVINVGREVASLSPMFSGLGIASMGLGAGIAAAAIGVRNFALGARDMSMFGKETGVAVERLRVLEAVGRRYGVSADQVRSNALGAADSFDQIRRRIGGLYQDLRSRGEFNLAENLVGSKDVNQYMEKVFDAAARMSNPKRRQEFLKNALGSDDFSKVINELGPKWRQFFAEVHERIGTMPAGAAEAAAAYAEAMGKMGDVMDKLRINSMGPMLEVTAKLMEKWREPVTGGLFDTFRGIKDAATAAKNAIDEFDKGNYIEGLRKLFGGNLTPEQKAGAERYASQIYDAKPLPGTQTKAVSARMDRLAVLAQQFEKLNSAIDGGRITGGARENAVTVRDKLQDEIKRLTEELVKLREQGATVQQQSFGGGGFGGGGLIQNASFGGFGGSGGGPMGGMKSWADFRRGARQNIADANSASVSAPSPIATPQGDGRGSKGAGKTGQMMAWAIDQLRREGVPEANLRTAAAHLVGQATMESGLNPNLKHDYDPSQGRHTGFGIYGARDPKIGRGRMTEMFKWLDANGYARNSAEGQMREMSHRAASGKWGPTRNILFGGGTGNLERDTNTITRDFENPKVVNRRSHAVANALRIGPERAPAAGGFAGDPYAREKNYKYPTGGNMMFRAGDEMMQTAARSFGGLASPGKVEGSAKLTIDINGLPSPNYRARTSMDGMFKDVKLNAGKGQMLPETGGVDI